VAPAVGADGQRAHLPVGRHGTQAGEFRPRLRQNGTSMRRHRPGRPGIRSHRCLPARWRVASATTPLPTRGWVARSRVESVFDLLTDEVFLGVDGVQVDLVAGHGCCSRLAVTLAGALVAFSHKDKAACRRYRGGGRAGGDQFGAERRHPGQGQPPAGPSCTGCSARMVPQPVPEFLAGR